jgi:hypothetical protein
MGDGASLGLAEGSVDAVSALSPTESKGDTMDMMDWDQPATLIDLDGKAPLISTIRECVRHFGMFKASAKAQARILLTRPVAREGRKTRTWLLEPAEIEALVVAMKAAAAAR